MFRWVAGATLVGVVVVLGGPVRGEGLGKGRSLVLVGIGGHRAQVAYPQSPSFPFESGEVGGGIAYYRFMSDQWTLGASGAYHGGRMENNGHTTPGVTRAIDTRSFTVRVG